MCIKYYYNLRPRLLWYYYNIRLGEFHRTRALYGYIYMYIIKIHTLERWHHTSSLPGKLFFASVFRESAQTAPARSPRYRLKDGGRHGGFTLKTTLAMLRDRGVIPPHSYLSLLPSSTSTEVPLQRIAKLRAFFSYPFSFRFRFFFRSSPKRFIFARTRR